MPYSQRVARVLFAIALSGPVIGMLAGKSLGIAGRFVEGWYSLPLAIFGVISLVMPLRNPKDYFGGILLIALALFAFWASNDLPGMRGFAFGPGTAPRLFPLLVSTSRHGPADLADLNAVLAETPARPFLVAAGFLAHDPAAVRRLQAGEEPAGRLARTALMRSARTVVSQIERIAKAPAHATSGSASKAGS